MAQPSKIGPAFLFLFGVPFFAFGTFAAVAFLSSSPSVHRSGDSILGAIFASVFALIGAGLMVGAVYGYKQLKKEAAVKDANPDSPWLWKADWAANRAISRHRYSVFAWWIGTALTSMIAGPVAFKTLPQVLHDSDPKAFILIGFGLFPAILLVGALRATIRRERYGKTYFEFGSLPFSPGRHVKGQIQLRLKTGAGDGIDLRLACIRRIVTGAGKQQTTNEIVLWQDQTNVPQNALFVGPLGTAIPVDFAIPEDAYETNHDQPRDQVLWVLHAQADVAGVDYSDDFELPVFRTSPASATTPESSVAAAGSSDFRPTFGSDRSGTGPAFQSDFSDVSAPPNPKVVVSTAADGSTEFYFPAFRNRGRTGVLILFTVAWTGVVYYLWHSAAPWFFGAIFGLFDLLLIYGSVQAAFGTTTIIAGGGKIVSKREIFGIGVPREIVFTDIKSVLASMGIQQGTNAANASYSIRLQTKIGRDLILVDNIADRQEARWIVAQIEKLAGLKRDTHVELEAPFGGAYAPPPQRGSSVPQAFQNPPRRPSGISYAVAIAMFAAWTGYIFHRGFFNGHTSRNQRAATRLTPANSRQANARVVYAGLTDADIDRLNTLSPQAQAEELLDRAIQHDLRALSLFEEKIGSQNWLGRIKLTNHMKELERRSEYSSDLRVRYANADLNLSMDGWTKTEQSVDLLIERANSDPQYRRAAVYFMGMLAGRGIAYGRICPVLFDYAKNNPDANVRVWAIEGMGYLGSDEALDRLFDSFVNDSSMQVRDRAGCNVSDCGNFTRKQRMAMVPKLLSLAEDANTSPQMRNWTFLGLHEITDENLPNDASVWQNWYDQHGAEKLAKFEQQDWWRIRGDE